MAESYFGIHLCKLTTFSGTVGGQTRQVLLYIYIYMCVCDKVSKNMIWIKLENSRFQLKNYGFEVTFFFG
jgi:hypothetical protein